MMFKRTEVSKQYFTPKAEFARCDALLIQQELGSALVMKPGIRVGFLYNMKPHQRRALKVTVKAPADANPGDEFTVEFVQRNVNGEFIGGFDVRVRVVGEKKPPRMVKPPIIRERPVVKAKSPMIKKKSVQKARK